MNIIHYCDGNLHSSKILCNQLDILSAHTDCPSQTIHLTNNGRYYAFSEKFITCEQCKNQLMIKEIIE